jgi:hypothetical protein
MAAMGIAGSRRYSSGRVGFHLSLDANLRITKTFGRFMLRAHTVSDRGMGLGAIVCSAFVSILPDRSMNEAGSKIRMFLLFRFTVSSLKRR